MQHNSLDDELIANLRLNFIHRPGSDLFVVINEERGVEDSPWRLAGRNLAVKLTYLMRLF